MYLKQSCQRERETFGGNRRRAFSTISPPYQVYTLRARPQNDV